MPYNEGVYVFSDLIDVLWKLEIIGNPIHDDYIKRRYRNRRQWTEFYAKQQK